MSCFHQRHLKSFAFQEKGPKEGQNNYLTKPLAPCLFSCRPLVTPRRHEPVTKNKVENVTFLVSYILFSYKSVPSSRRWEERGRAMARTSSKVLAQVVVVMVLIAMVGGSSAATICNIDTSKLAECLPAVSGRSPPPPTKACCTALLSADLHCLCNYKSALPAFGINPALAMALPKKCGGSLPPNCKGNKFKLHFSSSLWRSFIHHITAFLTWVPMPSC